MIKAFHNFLSQWLECIVVIIRLLCAVTSNQPHLIQSLKSFIPSRKRLKASSLYFRDYFLLSSVTFHHFLVLWKIKSLFKGEILYLIHQMSLTWESSRVEPHSTKLISTALSLLGIHWENFFHHVECKHIRDAFL